MTSTELNLDELLIMAMQHIQKKGVLADAPAILRDYWGARRAKMRNGDAILGPVKTGNQQSEHSEMKLTLDTESTVFFYEQDFYVLSNFASFAVNVFGHEFPTSEHAYHWRKFSGTYPTIANAIRNARSAHDAFKIAAQHKDKLGNWKAVRLDVMREILRAKIEQHEYVKRKLLATGTRDLVENSWRDDFWGWGELRDGKNMLGKIWMEIRAELRAVKE